MILRRSWLRVANVLRRRCRSINASATSCFLGMSIPRFRRRLFLPFSASLDFPSWCGLYCVRLERLRRLWIRCIPIRLDYNARKADVLPGDVVVLECLQAPAGRLLVGQDLADRVVDFVEVRRVDIALQDRDVWMVGRLRPAPARCRWPDDLLKLQQNLIDAVAPFTAETGTAAAFVTTPKDPDINKPTIDYVATFVPKASGKDFNPHVTVGIASQDFVWSPLTKTSVLRG